MRKLTPHQEAEAIKAVAKAVDRCGSIRMGAIAIGQSYGWTQRFYQLGLARGIIKRKEVAPQEPEQIILAGRAKEAAKEKESENSRVRKFLEEENERLRQLVGIQKEIANIAFSKIPVYKPEKGGAIVLAVGSDWHAGERVDLADVPGGRNEYNPDIFKRRAHNFFRRSLYLTDMVRNGPSPIGAVDTMALFLLGDLITGWLHDDQRETNWLTPTQEFVLVYKTIAEGIEYLLSNGGFKKLVIVTADGNHDRTTEKMRVKNQGATSLSNMMYRLLKAEFDKHTKLIDWHITDGYTNYIQLGNTIVRAHHGDGFQYGGGVGGFDIPLNKAIPRWNTARYADLDIFGHWHCLRNGSNYISNGSLIGHGAYSTKMVRASFEEPKQAFAVIDQRRKGVALFAPIYTEKYNEPR